MDSTACLILIGLSIIGFLVLQSQSRQSLANRVQAARDNYQASLSELKANPTNPDLKQKTLELGRVYSGLTRDNKSVTLFDEMALSNDINAATAAASIPAQIVASMASTDRATVEDRLSKLNDLRLRAVISETEYAEKRQKILDEI